MQRVWGRRREPRNRCPLKGDMRKHESVQKFLLATNAFVPDGTTAACSTLWIRLIDGAGDVREPEQLSLAEDYGEFAGFDWLLAASD